MSDENFINWISARFTGAIDNDELENVAPESGKTADVDDLVLLALFRDAYQHMLDNDEVVDGREEELKDEDIYGLLSTLSQSRRIQYAFNEGDASVLSRFIGYQGDKAMDSSSWRAADIITNELWKPQERDNMLNMIIYGPTPTIDRGSNTGTGKSDFGYGVIEGGIRAYERENIELKVATNNESDPFVTKQKWSEAKKWMRDTPGTKVMMIDEAAQDLMYNDMTAGRVLSNAMKLARHHNTHLILIDHTGMGVPADVRRQVVFARKESKKEVKLGNKLEEDESGELQIRNVEYEMENLPPTTIEYDSYDDTGEFIWDIDESDDDGDDGEWDRCQAMTQKGTQCQKEARYPDEEPEYCGLHRTRVNQ